MMYKQRRIDGILLSCMFLLGILLPCATSLAQEREPVPESDILIIYSDGASASEQAKLLLLAENLTYQDYRVTFAPASLCVEALENYERLLFYKVERYPEELVGALLTREREGADILFMGNLFLRDYLQQTGRKSDYRFFDIEVGNLQYTFSATSVKETLALEDGFLFLTDKEADTRGSVRLADTEGYFYANTGRLTHLTLTDLENPLVRAASFREISRWLWEEDYAQYTYAQYLVINQVYPFQNPDRLLFAIDKFIEQEQPFIITVMPIYEHEDYPAFERFCEVLRYAQANGGMIMIHSPLNQMAYFDADKVNEALTLAIGIYLDKGVYPMGLQFPESWLFRQDTLEVMSRFKTLLVAGEADRLQYADIDLYTNEPYFEQHQWIAPAIALDGEGTGYLTCYSSAVYFDIMDTEEEFDRRLNACLESEVPLKNIRDADHTVYTGTDELNYRNQSLYVNGELTGLSFTPAQISEDFSYNRNMLQRVSRDLTGQNQKLLLAVLSVSLLFILFIIIARYRNRMRFFVKLPAGGDEAQQEEDDYELKEIDVGELDDYDIKEIDPEDDYDL